MLDDFPDGLYNHPLARRFSAKLHVTGGQVFTAADVLGERLFMLSTYLHPRNYERGTNVQVEALPTIASLAVEASPYLWADEVVTSLNGITLPRHVVSPHLLAEPRMWWTFTRGITVGGHAIDSILVAGVLDGFVTVLFGNDGDRSLVGLSTFSYGKTFPDDFEDDPNERALLELILKFNSFLSSPHIPIERARLTRGERRELSRKGAADFGEHASFIVLRRPSSKAGDAGQSADAHWNHRWLVSGHFRAHWYPKEQAHHVIWIAPHLKGPEDAPLLEHVYKVAR